jgi:hypothetical protein
MPEGTQEAHRFPRCPVGLISRRTARNVQGTFLTPAHQLIAFNRHSTPRPPLKQPKDKAAHAAGSIVERVEFIYAQCERIEN